MSAVHSALAPSSWLCAETPSGAVPLRRSPAPPEFRWSRADHPDPLAGEIDAFVRPLSGVVTMAAKLSNPTNFGTFAVDRQPTAVIRKFAVKLRRDRSGRASD